MTAFAKQSTPRTPLTREQLSKIGRESVVRHKRQRVSGIQSKLFRIRFIDGTLKLEPVEASDLGAGDGPAKAEAV